MRSAVLPAERRPSFLGYGHDKQADLTRQLNEDLKARGAL
jgi:hypothetical protein